VLLEKKNFLFEWGWVMAYKKNLSP